MIIPIFTPKNNHSSLLLHSKVKNEVLSCSYSLVHRNVPIGIRHIYMFYHYLTVNNNSKIAVKWEGILWRRKGVDISDIVMRFS